MRWIIGPACLAALLPVGSISFAVFATKAKPPNLVPMRSTITAGVAEIGDIPREALIETPRPETFIDLQFADRLGHMAIQKEIASAFARLDPKVPDRIEHWAWVDLPTVGWWGRIAKLQPMRRGWLAEIEIGLPPTNWST